MKNFESRVHTEALIVDGKKSLRLLVVAGQRSASGGLGGPQREPVQDWREVEEGKRASRGKKKISAAAVPTRRGRGQSNHASASAER